MSHARSFGEAFKPLQWQGARTRQYADEEDAFQQLVGDALRSAFRDAAHVAPTRGRDGSIDAWVGAGVPLPPRFGEFARPWIVECKHHDASSPGVMKNVFQGWARVADKLKAKAASGWPGDYAPWKVARGYLYCVSVRFRLASDRDDLKKQIEQFFSSLPNNQRPPISADQIRVWDWGDLADWFRESRRLVDEWVGIDWPDLIGHAEYRSRIAQSVGGHLQSFRAYLLEENLPFVAPEIHDPTHPLRLFDRLLKGESLVLVGQGGIGKSRLTFETAEYAARKDWRVLHLTPSERAVDLRDIAGELLQHAGESLLVVDYIDQFRQFDSRFWNSTVVPEMASRGVRVALLSNARATSNFALEDLKRNGIFSIVPVSLSQERRRLITESVEDRLSGAAMKVIGKARVREVCGGRPIIAMFIARELEKLALTGTLSPQLAETLRPGDLVGWVNRRLREVGLITGPGTSPWNSVPIAPGLVAATAVLMATPMHEPDLVDVARMTINAMNENVAMAPAIISNLESSGWLERDEYKQLRTPHDSITDEAFLRLVDVDISVLPALLAGAELGTPFGRFAVVIGRVVEVGEHSAKSISDAASEWLGSSAKTLGERLVSRHSDFSAYAIGAVFDYAPWAEMAVHRWSDLVQPWLSAHGTEVAARHLLYQGLKRLTPKDAERMVAPARAWLAAHGGTLDASFLIRPLLDLPEEQLGEAQAEILETAKLWLELHGGTVDAQYVLGGLLRWSAHRLGDSQTFVLELAVTWLARYKTTAGATYVLTALLTWSKDRLGQTQSLAWDAAFRWLENHASSPGASYLLTSLLHGGPEQFGAAKVKVLDFASRWLDEHYGIMDAQFVLHALLRWPASDLPDKRAILDRALSWLRLHGDSVEAKFVLTSLFTWEIGDLGPSHGYPLETAIKWINKHGENVLAGWLYESLLLLPSSRLGVNRSFVIQSAHKWLESHVHVVEAGYVLSSLLSLPTEDLDEVHDELLISAQIWAEKYAETRDAGFVISRLLPERGISKELRRKLAAQALKLASADDERKAETHLLKALLQVAGRYRDDVQANEIVYFAGKWLDENTAHPERAFVLARLLRIAWLPNDSWERVARAGLDLLGSKGSGEGDDYLLNGVAMRIGLLDPAHIELWVAYACRWLETCKQDRDARRFLTYISKAALSLFVSATQRDRLAAAYRTRFPDESRFDWDMVRPEPRE